MEKSTDHYTIKISITKFKFIFNLFILFGISAVLSQNYKYYISTLKNSVVVNNTALSITPTSIPQENLVLGTADGDTTLFTIENLEQIRSLYPDYVPSYLLLADLYRLSGRTEKALEMLDKVETLDPNNNIISALKQEIR